LKSFTPKRLFFFAVVSFAIATALFLFARKYDDVDYNTRAKEIQRLFDEEVSSLRKFSRAENVKLNELDFNTDKPELVFFETFSKENNRYFISVYDSEGELVAWNNNFRKINDATPVTEISLEKPYHEKDNLFEIISVVTSLKTNVDNYYVKYSFVLEKHFSLHNNYEEHGDFAEKINAKYGFKLLDEGEIEKEIFPLNLADAKIANIAPVEKHSQSPLYLFSLVFVFFAFLFGAFAVSKEYSEDIRLKIIYSITYAITFRIVLFYFFEDYASAGWAFSRPEYFYSDLGGGFFASLLSLFFSVAVTLFVFNVLRKSNLKFNKSVSPVVFALSLIAYPFILRAFGATVRSLVFDSNIRVFSDEANLLQPVVAFYLLNVLLVSVAFVFLLLFAVSILNAARFTRKFYIPLLLLISVSVFHILEPSPQAPLSFKIIFTAILWVFAASKFFDLTSGRILIYSVLASGLFGVLLLGYHSADFERNLFVFAARKIVNPNKFYYEQLVKTEAEKISEKLAGEKIRLFNNSLAYRLWNSSELPIETYSSALEISRLRKDTILFYYNSDAISDEAKNSKYVAYANEDDGKYSVSCLVNFSPIRLFNTKLPDFFVTENQKAVSLARSLQLRLLLFLNDELVFSSAPATFTDAQKKSFLKKVSNHKNKIFNGKIGGKPYEFYAIKKKKEKAVFLFARPETHFIVLLFAMLKILGVFLIFVLTPAFLFSIPKFFGMKIKLTFRDAIFAGLVAVSIVPLVLLALYFRSLSEEKNLNSTLFKLNGKALAVGKYLHSAKAEAQPYELFEKAASDLRFDFSVFYKDRIYFTTHPLYFENGIIPDVLNPKAIVNIEIERLNDILLPENIERYERNVFYSKFFFNGENYIIQIDEAFNPILLPISEKDLDVMLVTSYSATALGIIILGLLLAYYLSKPINELTNATRKIARGNLDVKLETKAFGEVRELVEGFNYMARELKTTQKKLIETERESAWREMARQVAHEIKNPLTPMKLSLQQLAAMKREKDENFDSAFDKIIASVLSQIELLKNIAGEFSSVGKLPQVKLSEIELGELLKKVKNLYSNKNIEIVVENSLAGVKVNSDEEYLTRIFVNLFGNAEDAGATKIAISAQAEKDNVVVFVKNNGEPVPDEIKDKIFEKNFTTKNKGSGLGLFISARFLDETGGKIELLKSDEKETVFKIILKKNERN